MSQNEDEVPNGMNILALKPDNDKKTSNYDLYKKEGGENSATDMFQVGSLILNLVFRDTISTRKSSKRSWRGFKLQVFT